MMLLMLSVVPRVSFGAPVGDGGELNRNCARQMQLLQDNWDKIYPRCDEQRYKGDEEKKDCDIRGNMMGLLN